MNQYLEYIGLLTGSLLMLIGLFGILTRRDLLRMVIGFSVMDTGLHVIMVSIAWLRNATAPILDESLRGTDVASQIADPLPQALVLTAIVIGLGVTALMLAFVLRMYKEKGSLEIKQFSDLKW